MMRLIKRGLMFGNLVEVSSPALVARYNRALEHLTQKVTTLSEFHIDICGYSPEIGDELGDTLYLNPKGCNQQFIFLTTEQKAAPLLSSQFSTSHAILKSYIEDNEEELFALTAREAVAGELLNSVFQIDTPSDLFQINQITVEADTIGEHVANAKVLQSQIDRFIGDEDAWWDDVLISQMIELGKQTGNIVRHPIQLSERAYGQGNFYTRHFGGLYVFRDTDVSTLIARDPKLDLSGLSVDQAFSLDDRRQVARFLRDQNLAELIVSGPNSSVAAIVKQKIEFITIATAAEHGEDLSGLHRQQLRSIGRKYADQMPEEFHGLMKVWRWSSLGGEFPNLSADHAAYFYALRSSQHDDRDLVNMLLADLSPLDFRQLFICHKDAFYTRYQTYSDSKKDYVAQFLDDEYIVDKAGAREALFGDEPSTEPRGDAEPEYSSKATPDYQSDNPWSEAPNPKSKKSPKSEKKSARRESARRDRQSSKRPSNAHDTVDEFWNLEQSKRPKNARDRSKYVREKNKRDLDDIRWLRDNWRE